MVDWLPIFSIVALFVSAASCSIYMDRTPELTKTIWHIERMEKEMFPEWFEGDACRAKYRELCDYYKDAD
jgi:hypothetical protein